MNKLVAMPKEILDDLVKAAGWSPETTLERPLTPAQERAENEDEWVVVGRSKLQHTYCRYRCPLYNAVVMTNGNCSCEDWYRALDDLTTPQEKGHAHE